MIKNLFFDLKSVLSLEAFASKQIGMSDLLLPVCFCDDGILLNKDGSFSQSFWYSGADLDSTTDEELDLLNSSTYSNAFSHLGDGWTMHLDCVRKTKNGYIDDAQNHFQDPTSLMIDLERKLDYEREDANYFNYFVITFTYLPPVDNATKTKNWFIEDRDGNLSVDYFNHLTLFKAVLAEVLDLLSYRVYTVSLTNEETMSYLNYAINGFDFKFAKYKNGWIDLNYRLASQDAIRGFTPKVGDYHVGVVSVGEGLPFESYPALLHELTTLQFEYRWSTRFIFLDTETAKKLIDATADYHYQSRESIKQALANKNRGAGTQRFNRGAEVFADQAEDALALLDTEVITYGKYTCSVVIFDKDVNILDSKMEQVKKVINSAGFLAKREEANCFDAYLGAIPGMVRNNVRKWVIDTINLADIMPTTSTWSGYDKHPCQYYKDNNPPLFYATTQGSTPFHGCTYVGDVGHTLIIGPTRAGKSVLLNFLVAQQFRYKNARVFHFDNGYSSLPLCYAMNGAHFDIANQTSHLSFKPLALLNNQTVVGEDRDKKNDFSFCVQWLSEIAEINLGRKIKSEEREAITRVLQIIKENSTNEQKTLTYFYLQLKPKNAELAKAFVEYTTTNSASTLKSKMFNAIVDKLELNRFAVFELNRLLKTGDEVFIPTIRYLMYMLQRSFDGSPTFIVFEEAWAIVKNEIMQNMLEDFLRTAGKYNVAIIFCTQQVSDILQSSISSILLDQCKTKIFLPNNSTITNDMTANLYAQMGLNYKQMSMIGYAIPQRQYYFSNSIGNRLFNLSLGDVALAFLARTGAEDIKIAHKIKAKYGDEFGYHWLKLNKQDDAAEYWLHTYNEMQTLRGSKYEN